MSTKKPVSTEVENIKTEELKTEQLDPVDVMDYREYYAGKAEKADEKAASEADVASVAETASEAETTSEQTEETENTESIAVKIRNWIVSIFLFAVIILTVYVMVCAARGRAANLFGKSILKVVTGSMEPTILTNDYIKIEKTAVEKLEVGDIIAFYSEDPQIKGKLVIHRIVKINEDGSFTVRGDANPIDDKYPVKPEKVAGKYAGKARFFIWVNSFADTKKLLLLLVIIPIFLVSIYEVRSMGKLMKEVKAEEERKKEAKIRSKLDEEKLKLERQELIEKLKKEAVEEYLAKEKAGKDNTEASPFSADSEPVIEVIVKKQ